MNHNDCRVSIHWFLQCWDPWEPGQVHQFFQRRHCPTKQKAEPDCARLSGGSRNPTRKLWSWICGKARWQSERQPKRKTLEGGKLVRMIRLSNPPKLAVMWPPNGLTSFNFSAMVLDHVSHIFNIFNIPKIAHEKPTQKACCVLDPFILDFPWFSPCFLATKSWPWHGHGHGSPLPLLQLPAQAGELLHHFRTQRGDGLLLPGVRDDLFIKVEWLWWN